MAKGSYLPHKVCLGCQENLPESKFRFILNPKTGKGSVLSDYCQNCDRTSSNNELPGGELCARQPVGEPPANERRPSTRSSKLLSDGVPPAESDGTNSNGVSSEKKLPPQADRPAVSQHPPAGEDPLENLLPLDSSREMEIPTSFDEFKAAWEQSDSLDGMLSGQIVKRLACALASQYLAKKEVV